MESIELRHIIEAMIFVSDRPLSVHRISEVLGGMDIASVRGLVDELNHEYEAEGRSFLIKEVAGGYRFETHPRFGPYLKKMFQQEKMDRLSRPQLETIAIIAYKQPVTKPEIESIRGVNCDGVIKILLDKGLIKVSGRLDGPGRPFAYSTTDEFLELFGLASVKDLPPLKEVHEEQLEASRSLKLTQDGDLLQAENSASADHHS